MYKLMAQIDSFNPLWDAEFVRIMTNEVSSQIIKEWLLNNCAVDPEFEDEVFDDVIIQDPEFIITYRDLMCETVSLYYI